MSRSTAPFLAILLLGLAAALYFIFAPTESVDDNRVKAPINAESSDLPALDAEQTSIDDVIGIRREKSQFTATENGSSTPVITEVKVLGPDGLGIAGARVLPWVGEQLEEEVLTNELGKATLTGLEGEGGYAVMAPNYLAVHSSHSFDGSLISVQLRAGQVLAGRVVFQQPPISPEPFLLYIFTMPSVSSEGIPKKVKEQFWVKKAGLSTCMVRIDEEGHFQLKGLPENWSGRIRMPRGYLVCSVDAPAQMNGNDFIDIPHASQGYLIRCLELPAFTGRVVTPDGATGVAGAMVDLHIYLTEEKNNSTWIMGESKGDGSFYIPIYASNSGDREAWCENPDSITPFWLDANLTGSKEWADADLSFDLANKDQPWELGDLPMKESMKLAFRVVDQQGKPITGARAFSFVMSEPTDSDGIGQVSLSDEIAGIWVGAKGYRSASAAIPDSLSETVEIVLEGTTRLHVTWSSPEEVDMSDVTVRILSSQGSIYTVSDRDGIWHEERFHRLEGLQMRGGRGPNPSGEMSRDFKIEAGKQEFDIWGLADGRPFEVRLAGLTGAPIASSMVTLKPGEHRDLDMKLTTLPTRLGGRVTDSNGAPVASVQVSLGYLDDRGRRAGASTRTDKEGEFQFKGLAVREVNLSLEKDGYVITRVPGIQITESREPLQFTMEPGRKLAVYFQDESGRFYEKGFVEGPGKYLREPSLDNGGLLYGALPMDEFTLDWQIGGAKGTQLVPAEVTEHVIMIPILASASIHATRTDSAERGYVLVKFIPVGPAREDVEVYEYERSVSFKKGEITVDREYPTLLPGTYRVEYSTRELVNGKRTTPILAEQGPFEVAAGQTLELDLRF